MKPRYFNFQFSIFNFIVLALLFVGCTKEEENADRINIFANNMNNGGAKVWVDPASPNGATWVAGEYVNLNGTPYSIRANTGSNEGPFSLDKSPLGETMYAVYPATTRALGDTLIVVNSKASGADITIRSLAVNFRDGGHRIIFPMGEKAAANSGSLYFDHLTGGLRLTLANSSNTAIDIDHIKVVVQGSEAAPAVVRDEVSYIVHWAVQGPTMPSGDVGGISGDQVMSYSSEMNFKMQTNSEAGVSVPASGSISFCVPVTVRNVKKLSITGYNASGVQLFTKVKNLDSPLPIAVNEMYNIPSFNINNN